MREEKPGKEERKEPERPTDWRDDFFNEDPPRSDDEGWPGGDYWTDWKD